jgi:hypothetical protein
VLFRRATTVGAPEEKKGTFNLDRGGLDTAGVGFVDPRRGRVREGGRFRAALLHKRRHVFYK